MLANAFASLKDHTDRVEKFLAAKQFGESEISLGAIDTTKKKAKDRHGEETEEIASYQLSRTFTITSPNVKNVAKASSEVTPTHSA